MTLTLPRSIETETDLRAIYQTPTKGAVAKELDHIDRHCRRFIELSPFLCLGTMGRDGAADVSPRGGERGFVHVLDEKHLAMPDRPGNNRLDSFGNILERPAVALAFFVPGFEDVVRVNGTARITTDPTLMDRFAANGRPPRAVVVIEVKEALLHCGKAIKRAGLWDPAAQLDRSIYPSAGQILRDQLSMDATDKSAAAIEDYVQKDARDNLY